MTTDQFSFLIWGSEPCVVRCIRHSPCMAIRVSVLGSGSRGNATFIKTEQVRLLIDAGMSRREIGKRLEAIGEDPDGIDAITSEVLERTEISSDMKRILFGTSNSHLWAKGVSEFQTDFVAITEDGAEWLVEKGVQLVGVDYLSVAPYGDSTPTHSVLLKAGVVVVEGLNLSQVMRGFYDLYCLPLKIAGSDGAPARAILIQS